MSDMENAQIARDSVQAAIDQDWDRLLETYAEDAVMTGGSLRIEGNQEIVNLWRGCHEEELELEGEILNVMATGDMVAVEWRHKAIVNQPDILGLPPETFGKRIEAIEVYISKVLDGKIVSTVIYGGSIKFPDMNIRRVWVVE